MTFPLAIRDFSKQNWPGMSLDTVAEMLRVSVFRIMNHRS